MWPDAWYDLQTRMWDGGQPRHRDCCGGLPGMPISSVCRNAGQSDACGGLFIHGAKKAMRYMAYESAKKDAARMLAELVRFICAMRQPS